MYTEQEKEQIFGEINAEFKKKISESGYSSRLRKVPNGYGEYKNKFGSIEYTLQFKQGYFSIDDIRINKYSKNQSETMKLFVNYVKTIADSFKIPVVSLNFWFSAANELKNLLAEHEIHESIDTLGEFPFGPNIFLFDNNGGITLQGSSIYNKISDFFERKHEENNAVVYERANTENLFAYKYYYRGYEGKVEVIHNSSNYQLIDNQIDFEQEVLNVDHIDEYLESMLQMGYEQNRLKNMFEPNRKHFDNRMDRAFKLHPDVSEVIFKHLMGLYEPEEIEEKIIFENLESSEDSGIKIINIFDYLFVTKSNYSTDVACFHISEKEEAIKCYKERIIENKLADITMKMKWFNDRIDDKYRKLEI